MPNGRHEIKGVKVGGPYVQVDMFRIYNPAGGNWKKSGPNNFLRTTGRNEDFVQLDFTGTAVQFLAPQGPGRGTIEVFLDGQSVRQINQYHGTPKASLPLVSLTNRPPHALPGEKARQVRGCRGVPRVRSDIQLIGLIDFSFRITRPHPDHETTPGLRNNCPYMRAIDPSAASSISTQVARTF